MIKMITQGFDPRSLYDCSQIVYDAFEYDDDYKKPCCRECDDYDHRCRDECHHCHHEFDENEDYDDYDEDDGEVLL